MENPQYYLSDEQIMLQVQSGDRKSFELIFERYRLRLFNFIFRQIGDKELAEDLLHDVFIKVIECALQFDSQRKFSTWIYTVAINVCRNEARNSVNRHRIIQKNISPEIFFHHNHDEQLDKHGFSEKLNALIKMMDEENKTILLLRFHEELTIPEISAIVQIPEGTIKSRLYYILKKLATQLQAYNPVN